MRTSTNIRVDRKTYEELERLAELRSQSQGEVAPQTLESVVEKVRWLLGPAP